MDTTAVQGEARGAGCGLSDERTLREKLEK